MSFLPDWWSKGTTPIDNNGGFGTAGMFNKPSASQTGDFGGYLPKLINALRNRSTPANTTPDATDGVMPQTNAQPQMTPYQTTPIGSNMGQVNNPYAMSPNGQIMPNWNRTYGGY